MSKFGPKNMRFIRSARISIKWYPKKKFTLPWRSSSSWSNMARSLLWLCEKPIPKRPQCGFQWRQEAISGRKVRVGWVVCRLREKISLKMHLKNLIQEIFSVRRHTAHPIRTFLAANSFCAASTSCLVTFRRYAYISVRLMSWSVLIGLHQPRNPLVSLLLLLSWYYPELFDFEGINFLNAFGVFFRYKI